MAVTQFSGSSTTKSHQHVCFSERKQKSACGAPRIVTGHTQIHTLPFIQSPTCLTSTPHTHTHTHHYRVLRDSFLCKPTVRAARNGHQSVHCTQAVTTDTIMSEASDLIPVTPNSSKAVIRLLKQLPHHPLPFSPVHLPANNCLFYSCAFSSTVSVPGSAGRNASSCVS